MTPEEAFALQAEIAALREELWEQWEANHIEHCSRTWPHPEGKLCHWPLPEVLGSSSRAASVSYSDEARALSDSQSKTKRG